MIQRRHAGTAALATRTARSAGTMKIKHQGLRMLYEKDDRARLPANLVPRLGRILFSIARGDWAG